MTEFLVEFQIGMFVVAHHRVKERYCHRRWPKSPLPLLPFHAFRFFSLDLFGQNLPIFPKSTGLRCYSKFLGLECAVQHMLGSEPYSNVALD
jgi:hypothetical protein